MASGPFVSFVDILDGAPAETPISPIPTSRFMRLSVANGVLLSTVDGVTFTPIGAGGGFGSDVTVPLANSSSQDVTGLELVAALTNLNPGSETSQWTIKLINAGTPGAVAMNITPAQTQFPVGTAAAPGVSFQGATGYGITQSSGLSRLQFTVGTGSVAGAVYSGGFIVPFDGGNVLIGSAAQSGMSEVASSGDLIFSAGGNISIGNPGALATTAIHGHLEIPTCAGTPTGTVVVVTGKAALILDTTGSKLWTSTGGGTWKGVVVA